MRKNDRLFYLKKKKISLENELVRINEKIAIIEGNEISKIDLEIDTIQKLQLTTDTRANLRAGKLLLISDVIKYYKENGSFIKIRNIGKTKNEEIIEAIKQYI